MTLLLKKDNDTDRSRDENMERRVHYRAMHSNVMLTKAAIKTSIALHCACLYGRIEEVKYLINDPARINAIDEVQMSLHLI